MADGKWSDGRTRGHVSRRRRHECDWLLFAIFSALALLTHYAAVFALVVLWGWALAWALFGVGQVANLSYRPASNPAHERWLRLRTVLLAGVLTALLCLPGLPVALRQIPSYRNPNLVVPPVGGYLAELARVYGLGEHLDAAAAQPWVWALAGWLVIGWVLAVAMLGRGECGDTGDSGDTANQRHQRIGDIARIRHYAFVIRSSPSPGPSCPSSSTTWSSVTGQPLPRATSALRCRVGSCWAGWRCAAGQDWDGALAPWLRLCS